MAIARIQHNQHVFYINKFTEKKKWNVKPTNSVRFSCSYVYRTPIQIVQSTRALNESDTDKSINVYKKTKMILIYAFILLIFLISHLNMHKQC